MLWKLALGIGLCGIVIGIIFVVIAVRAFYSAGFQSNDEDIAFAGLIISIILLVVSLLITLVSAIFVLRGSKKEWEAENLK